VSSARARWYGAAAAGTNLCVVGSGNDTSSK
jgi:hypothetical protein